MSYPYFDKLSLPEHELCTDTPVIHKNFLTEKNQGLLGFKYTKGTHQIEDWGIEFLNIDKIWENYKVTGKGVKVAVLDTGVDGGNVDISVAIGSDFSGSSVGWKDVQGHGTHVAGIIAARNNSIGVVGVAYDAEIYAGKVLGDNGSGCIAWIANGIHWAITQKVDVINMSLGGAGPIHPMIKTAIDRAVDSGIIVCVAAGNSGNNPGAIGAPGCYGRCVTVGAVDQNKNVAPFSSRGDTVDICAPGVEILSTYPGNRMTRLSGTSMATPVVSGIAALYVEMCRKVGTKPSQSHFENLAISTALDISTPGKDNNSGYGIIQPLKMFEKINVFIPNPKKPWRSL